MPNFLHLGLLQLLVWFILWFWRKHREAHLYAHIFSSRVHFFVLNLAAMLAVWDWNMERQMFCVPVLWAKIVMILAAVGMLFRPLISSDSRWKYLLSACAGLGLFVLLYVLLFAGIIYTFILIFLGLFAAAIGYIFFFVQEKMPNQNWQALYLIPLLLWTPVLWGHQLFLLTRIQNEKEKRYFFAAPALLFMLCLALSLRLGQQVERLHYSTQKEKVAQSLTANPLDRYLLELILGAQWKYHTVFPLCDGEKPPFHDPVLGLYHCYHPSHWEMYAYIFGSSSYFEYKHAKVLYAKFFPHLPQTFDCRCGRNLIMREGGGTKH